jgi:hypothetical protein
MRAHVLMFGLLSGLLAGCSGSGDDASIAAQSSLHHVPAASAAVGTFGVHASTSLIANLPDRGSLLAYAKDRPVKRGASIWHPVQMSEAHALDAIARGQMVIDAPDGQLIRLKYDRHVEHPDGNWTWIGHPLGAKPGVEAVLTFGEKAVFGTIPYGTEAPLKVTMAAGRTWLVETDSRLLGTQPQSTTPVDADVVSLASLAASAGMHPSASGTRVASAPVKATASAGTTVDLLLGYTAGFADRLGGASQANTRLTYIVDVANQAYTNSNVDAQLRLVHTMQVDYADATSNRSALYALSGLQCTSNQTGSQLPDGGVDCTPATRPAALQSLIDARNQYGADLVSLVRKLEDPENQSCGIGWLLGGGQSDNTNGDLALSVISDSSGSQFPDNGNTCRDQTLAHELGHNMGLQHDRATASGTDDTNGDGNLLDPEEYGRYPYSFGYSTDSTAGNFVTIMGVPKAGQSTYSVFSNPDITACGGRACGIADQADNARALRQTMPVVANYRTTAVSDTTRRPRNDFDGDGRSDIGLWNAAGGYFAYWRMNGGTYLGAVAQLLGVGLEPVSTGHVGGTAQTDLLMVRPLDRTMLQYIANNGPLVQNTVGNYDNTWTVAGQGDIDGDGLADIFWRQQDSGYFAYWLMHGAVYTGGQNYTPPATYQIAAIDDFNGDGIVDIVWNDPGSRIMSMWLSTGSGFSVSQIGQYGAEWRLIGSADVTGDGKADLLWRNTDNSYVAYWNMDGPVYLGAAAFGSPVDQTLVTTGDYNGDGKDDLLMSRDSDNMLFVWLSTGSGFTIQQVGQRGAGWAVVK